jgi:hypothetical protein
VAVWNSSVYEICAAGLFDLAFIVLILPLSSIPLDSRFDSPVIREISIGIDHGSDIL